MQGINCGSLVVSLTIATQVPTRSNLHAGDLIYTNSLSGVVYCDIEFHASFDSIDSLS